MPPPGQPAITVGSGSTRSETQQAIRAVHVILDNLGISMGPCKVNRLVRQFETRVQHNGWSLLDFLANRLELTSEQRQTLAANPAVARIIAYADPTGETAVNNVVRGSR